MIKKVILIVCVFSIMAGCKSDESSTQQVSQTKEQADIDQNISGLTDVKDAVLNITVRNVSYPLEDPGGNRLAQYYKLRERQMKMPLNQTALFILDTWDINNPRLQDMIRVNIAEEIKQILNVARELDMLVMYSPSRPIGYDGILHQQRNVDLRGTSATPRSEIPEWISAVEVPENLWPPIDFIYRVGKYSQYSRFSNPLYVPYTTVLGIHKDILPKKRSKEFIENNLDRIMLIFKQNKILHLLYVGEATNQCIVQRNVGIRAMSARGFNTIIVRGATIGSELHNTIESQQVTEAAILDIEINNGFSVSKDNLLDALKAISASS